MLICIKLIVVLYNFIFWLTGVFILGLSAYLWWDSQNYLDINEVSTHYVTPFIALLILGALMTMIGFIGCCGAIRESKCLLLMYISICLILCVLSGAFLFWTIRNGEKVRERIRLDTTKLIKRNYGTGNTNATEMLIDRIQRYFSCCGIMGPEDWITSNYNNQTTSNNYENDDLGSQIQNTMNNMMNNMQFPIGPDQRVYRIPHSCCRTSNDMTSNNDYNENIINSNEQCQNRVDNIRGRDIQNIKNIQGLNLDGCIDKFQEFIRQKQLFIILIATVLIGVQILALLFSFCLFCAISRQDDK